VGQPTVGSNPTPSASSSADRTLMSARLAMGTPAPRPYDAPYQHGLHFEVEEVQRCITAGQLESTVMPPDESVALARTMDTIRDQISLTYPDQADRSPR
jgi:hypothetical protein